MVLDSDAPFLLLGGDALLAHRSGIGRMTAEIASHAAQHQGLAGLGLLMNGRCRGFDQGMLVPQETGQMPRGLFARLPAMLGDIGTLRGVRNAWRRRALSQGLRHLHPSSHRVVYHETNFIAAPFDGIVSVSVHDLFCLTDPDWFPADRRRWFERNLPRVLRDTSVFACVSGYTASELKRLFPETADRIRIVGHGVSPIFRPMDAAAAAPLLAGFGLRDRGYIFAASTLEPRKNFDRLGQAFSGLPSAIRDAFPLVIAGGNGCDRAMPVVPAGARLLGHVSDQVLAALTARAAVYAFVSEKEGFGMPILEAMASGTPLLTSFGSAMEDTAGGAALLTDPLDVAAIREGLRRLLEDAKLRDRLRGAGLARAKAFTWEKTIDELVLLWRSASQ